MFLHSLPCVGVAEEVSEANTSKPQQIKPKCVIRRADNTDGKQDNMLLCDLGELTLYSL